MNPHLLEWKVGPGSNRVLLSGVITETSNFDALPLPPAGELLTLDVSGISRINSSGIRQWVDFVQRLGRQGVAFALERCSPEMVSQLNVIADFLGDGDVRSVMAPFLCNNCHAEQLQELQLDEEIRAKLDATPLCPNCGVAMAFDDLPNQYLAFRQRLKPRAARLR